MLSRSEIHPWNSSSAALPSAVLALAALLVFATSAAAQAPAKPHVAVLEFQAVGASLAESSAVTDRLREELVRGGKLTVVERSKVDEIMATKAAQQAACSGSLCAEVGKLLGVNFMISGKVVKFSADAWQVSASLMDVESAQTLKAETVRGKGDVLSVLDKAVPILAAKLGG